VIDPNALANWLFGPTSRSSFRKSERRLRSTPKRFIAQVSWLEERCLMSVDPAVPLGSTTKLNQIFWNGAASTNPASPPPDFVAGVDEAPPEKTITITNTSEQTILPLLRGANTGKLSSNINPVNPDNLYDPQDYVNQEYRAYIGYVNSDNQQTLGLPAHATITFRVLLVFWDSERTYIVTDGKDLIPADPSPGHQNPFRYDTNSDRGVSLSRDPNSWVKQLTINSAPATGLVMFYLPRYPKGSPLMPPRN
jgi:hypothetical protein